MARGIDHLVLAVADLDAAGRLYEAMGFTVGARNRHPWGTENRIVQFPGSFLELITVGGGAAIPPHHGPSFSFGAFVADSLARREGLAMLVLESRNASADWSAFEDAGIGGFEPVSFSRLGRRPDGRPVHVAFTLAFARDALAPEVGLFVCQQHYPENFWNPAFQSHANGAAGVLAVTMLAENPSDHAQALSAFTGVRDFAATSAGLTFVTPRGAVTVRTAAAFAFETGLHLAETPSRLAGFTVAVADPAAVAARLAAAGIDHTTVDGAIVVAPAVAHGVAVTFRKDILFI